MNRFERSKKGHRDSRSPKNSANRKKRTSNPKNTPKKNQCSNQQLEVQTQWKKKRVIFPDITHLCRVKMKVIL
jgi:hypothetical protein